MWKKLVAFLWLQQLTVSGSREIIIAVYTILDLLTWHAYAFPILMRPSRRRFHSHSLLPLTPKIISIFSFRTYFNFVYNSKWPSITHLVATHKQTQAAAEEEYTPLIMLGLCDNIILWTCLLGNAERWRDDGTTVNCTTRRIKKK